MAVQTAQHFYDVRDHSESAVFKDEYGQRMSDEAGHPLQPDDRRIGLWEINGWFQLDSTYSAGQSSSFAIREPVVPGTGKIYPYMQSLFEHDRDYALVVAYRANDPSTEKIIYVANRYIFGKDIPLTKEVFQGSPDEVITKMEDWTPITVVAYRDYASYAPKDTYKMLKRPEPELYTIFSRDSGALNSEKIRREFI